MDPIFDQRRYLIPFRSGLLPAIFADTLVIGGGVAGLRAALAASEHGDTILLSKGEFKNTNTAWAQGGVAAALRADDSPGRHAKDTLLVGSGLSSPSTPRRNSGCSLRSRVATVAAAESSVVTSVRVTRGSSSSASRWAATRR